MFKRKKGYISAQQVEDEIINAYNSKQVNIKPMTENELLKYYSNNTDIIYQYLRAITNKHIFVISNEIRAMMGHIADYRANVDLTKKNLENAYGHFRRMNLDAFKILCDLFDKSLSKQLVRDYSYDYRNVCKDYLESFSKQYFRAKKQYLEAQISERSGSDRDAHNIIELYHKAAVAYIQLKQYSDKNVQAIHYVKIKTIIRRIVLAIIGTAGVLFNIVPLIEK